MEDRIFLNQLSFVMRALFVILLLFPALLFSQNQTKVKYPKSYAYKYPNIYEEDKKLVDIGEEFMVTGEYDGFYRVKIDGDFRYILAYNFKKDNLPVKNLSLNEIYPSTTINNKTIRLNMSKKQVSNLLGEPNDINKTTGSWGTNEQWVYDSANLYFENGKLTSWQE